MMRADDLLAESSTSSMTQESPNVTAASTTSMLEIPFQGSANNVLVSDIDSNGLLDLAFTSHSGNFTQAFFQRAPRQFEPGTRIDEVGYHPGNLIQVNHEQGKPLLMSGEGEGRLFTMEYKADDGIKVIAGANVPYPRYTTSFHWPNWDLGLAIAPYSPPSVILLQNYDPFTLKAKKLVNLEVKGTAYPLESLTAADLDGDGSDEIVLPVYQWGTLMVIRHPGPETKVKIENLWDQPRLGPVKYVVAADVDNDGKVDLLAPQESPKPDGDGRTKLNILLNEGEAHFNLFELEFPTRAKLPMRGIRAIDSAVDRDGLRYIIAAGYEDYVLYQIPANHDLHSITKKIIPYSRKEGMFKVILRDIDGDGWLDLVVARGRDKNAGLVVFGPLWNLFEAIDSGPKEPNAPTYVEPLQPSIPH